MKRFNGIVFLVYFFAIKISAADFPHQFSIFDQFRTDKIFTDFSLVSNSGKEHPCHRIVLAAHNPYLKSMLTKEMKEKQSNCILLPYSIETIEKLLDLIYQKKSMVPICQ